MKINLQKIIKFQVPVDRELEFPCERTTLYDTYNPFHVDKSHSPLPGKGKSNQVLLEYFICGFTNNNSTLSYILIHEISGSVDQYKLGDLGYKHGLIEGHKSFSTSYNETQLSLFGLHSILGRSVVLYSKVKII